MFKPLRWGLPALVGLLQAPVFAQAAGTLPLLIGAGGQGVSYSVPIQTLLF
jgi:flagellar biosynthetic protein FliP